MRKIVSYLPAILLIFLIIYYFLHSRTKHQGHFPSVKQAGKEKDRQFEKLKLKATQLKKYAFSNRYSTEYGFLLDMNIPSGRKRLFIYDFKKDSIIHSGLAAHGSCNANYLQEARFSNTPGCGCSANGKYKIGDAYNGRFGKAYKLFGLDSSNSKAFERNIVLHAYSCIPDYEIYPQSTCNSLGCPMVSYKFLETASTYIDKSKKPVLLWIF